MSLEFSASSRWLLFAFAQRLLDFLARRDIAPDAAIALKLPVASNTGSPGEC
jgi:hypothetical protein